MTARFLKEASCCKADTSFCTAPLFQLGWNSSAAPFTSWTTCATWKGCSYGLKIQARTRTLKKVRRTEKREQWSAKPLHLKLIHNRLVFLTALISLKFERLCVSAALILSRSELFLKINFTLSSNSNSFYFKGFGAEANYLVVKPQTKWVRTPQVGWSIMEKSIFLLLYSIVYITGFFFLSVEPSHHMMNINKLNVKSLQNNL